MSRKNTAEATMEIMEFTNLAAYLTVINFQYITDGH